MIIKYLSHSEINFDKWDKCIKHSKQSLPYAESWYMDIVSPQWAALVGEEYETVMPLPKNRKYGISYYCQPPMCQQLGVFSKEYIDENHITKFIKKIPLRPYNLTLNSLNKYSKAVQEPNYIITLDNSYEILSNKFSKNTIRNISKARKAGTKIIYKNRGNSKNEFPTKIFLEFFFTTPKSYDIPDKNIISKIIQDGFLKDKLEIFFAYNKQDKLIAAVSLLKNDSRIIYFLPISNREALSCSAMFFMVDRIIRKYENSGIKLDFEGSRIESIARFYKGFGGELTPYYRIKRFI